MEQVVTQLQQEVFSGKLKLLINVNLATAQGEKDIPSLIDVKDMGRPKEISGKEVDFQQWSRTAEAFFAGMIQECEMMLEWSAEQAVEITTELVDLEFSPTSTKQERGIQNQAFVLQYTALAALTSDEAK